VTHRCIRVACASVPLREGRAVRVGDREIALFNLGDRFLAVDNRCPHRNGPLADGIVTGASVVCPLHAWKVNLERGCVERPSNNEGVCVVTYPAHIENGEVVIELPEMSDAAGVSTQMSHLAPVAV